MRTRFLLAIGFVSVFIALRAPASDPARPADSKADRVAIDDRFRDSVKPFLATYCVGCHGAEKPKGDVNLAAYSTVESVAKDLDHWEMVLEQLESAAMPPSKAKAQPKPELRRAVIDWVRLVRASEARRNAGDPGPVVARRLSNAEYDHTIRDLTGVDIKPTREFPVDPANKAGFDNSGESLTMSPSLVKKYLEAARFVTDHLVLKPKGFAFADYTVVADTDRDKYSVRRIIDFYKRQKTNYADFFLAAWKFKNREALGKPDATLADFASEAGLSPNYLAKIWSILNEPAAEFGPIAALQSIWKELPAPGDRGVEAAQAGIGQMKGFVIELRDRLSPEVKNLRAPGISEGSQTLILWKNRQFVANRRRYVGGAEKLKKEPLKNGTETARALLLPNDLAELPKFEADFARFCSNFPDAFFISERARVFLGPKGEKGNEGRLLNAGFHSMTGYFRDDAPLSDLILDDQGRAELDQLWRDFDFVTGAPARQYASFLWFERAETNTMRAAEYDFARAEDKAAATEPLIRRLSEVYLERTKKRGASEVALQAIRDYFEIMNASLRQVEADKVESESSHVSALQEFAEKAYRRPLSAEERESIAGFYRSLRQQDGLAHDDAVRDTLASILMSPHFCYRLDEAAEGASSVRPLGDYALASRLSYFLWASLPDAELLAHAKAGDLHQIEVLEAQTRRMLKDDRIRGLATEFAGNWLDFRRFEEHNSVSRERFPSFNDELRRSMFEEPIQFFIDVARNDRSILDFLDANHTFVNPSLARHYGMPVPKNGPDGWARVDDARRFGRGGLLPMAVFLTKNAPGLRTSPVKRGYWVVKRLLGENIPAPPANVPDLPSDESKLGDLTLREALARHRADVACAGCHERFDAIGLAFEGYGPVGESRKVDLGGRPVDARGNFPGGGEGDGFNGLRAYLDQHRRDEFVDNLCRKLLTYGLGRSLQPSDDLTIDSMRKKLSSDGNRFGALIETIVTSPQFLNKRVEADKAE
jgi:mono/diheme cytochrome c family protein